MFLSGDLEGGFLRVEIISDCYYEKAEEYHEILWITPNNPAEFRTL